MARHPRAGGAAAVVRLDHVRRGRLDPRHHGRGHRADRHRDHAAADGAPHRGQPLGRRAAQHHRRATPAPASATCCCCAATRPATRRASGSRTRRGCTYADELVRLVRRDRRLLRRRGGVPGEAPALAGLRAPTSDYFVRKCAAAPSSRSPRCSSDWEDYVRLRDGSRRAGCDVPIVPGVMPVTNVDQIERMAQLSGAAFPPQARRPASSGRRRPRGGARDRRRVATEMSERLLAEGAPGHPLHHPQPLDRHPRGVAEPRRGRHSC